MAMYTCSGFHLAVFRLKVSATFGLLKPVAGTAPHSPTRNAGHLPVKAGGLVALAMTAPAYLALLESYLCLLEIPCYPHHNQIVWS